MARQFVLGVVFNTLAAAVGVGAVVANEDRRHEAVRALKLASDSHAIGDLVGAALNSTLIVACRTPPVRGQD